ncbi:MAG TPA: hypothetical protein VFK41_04545 [Nocardioidaceae bacterium]|nr:hypothetical protein [Nocardioidaceae bacterium]
MGSSSTLQDLGSSKESRRRRIGRRSGFAVLVLVVGAGLTGFLGPSEGTDTAEGGGYTLTVTHGAKVRSGQPVPLEITVEGPGAFSGPVELAFDPEVFDRFDFQNWYPNPDGESRSDSELTYEFAPPDGNVLVVHLDARVAPGLGISRNEHWIAVMDGSEELVRIDYTVWVMP